MGIRIGSSGSIEEPYCGVREDARLLHRTFTGDVSQGYEWSDWIGLPFVLVDLPCSAVLDTLLLPSDLASQKDEKLKDQSLSIENVSLSEMEGANRESK